MRPVLPFLNAFAALALLCACAGGPEGADGTNGGGGTPTFTLALAQGSGSGSPGQTVGVGLQVQPGSGFSSAVSLSASNLPAGVSAAFSPNPLAPGTTSGACTFTLSGGAAAVAAHPVQVTASGGGVTRSATFALTVTAPVQDFSLALQPAAGTVAAGGSVATTVTVSPNGYAGAVNLTAAGLPAGVSASFQPATLVLSGPATATLTLSASGAVQPAGGQTFTVQATGGALVRSATYSLSTTNPNAPGVDLSLSTASVVLLAGGSQDLNLVATPRNGFTGTVSPAATGLPGGVTAQFSPATLTLGGAPVATQVRLTASASAPALATAVPVGFSTAAQGAGASLSLRVAAAGDPVARRLAAVAAVEARFNELSALGTAPLALVQQVAATMAARSDYQTTGVDAEMRCAWGRFKDGGLHVVAANFDPPRPTPGVAPPLAVAAAGAELPGAMKATLMHRFGPGFTDLQEPITEMDGYLKRAGWTTRLGTEGEAVVGTLKGVSGDGFFYFNTHGGRCEVDDPAFPDRLVYALQSSTLVDDDYEKVFDADLKAFKLVHFTAKNGNWGKDWLGRDTPLSDTRYGITAEFIKAYMSFAPGSVVWLNACYSGRATDLLNAFKLKGAAVVFGWSDLLTPAAMAAATPYFVERMLGVNQHPIKESPAQRAFAWDKVLADMTTKTLHKDFATGALLQGFPRSGLKQPPIFAPSIRALQVDEYEDELVLVGEFGTEAGKVTVNGQEVGWKTWEPDKVVCTLPQSGAGSAGDAVVEVKGVKSNARQLTEWALTVNYTWAGPADETGMTYTGTAQLRFRADVTGHRTAPAEALKHLVRGGSATKDSTMTITGAGTHTPSGSSCSKTLSGTGIYVSPAKLGGVPGNMIGAGFKVDADTRQAALGLALGAVNMQHRITLSGRDCSGTYETTPVLGLLDGPVDLPWDQSDNAPTGWVLPGITFTLDNAYGIPAHTHSTNDFGGTLTVKWNAAAAKFPPRDGVDAGR